MRIAKKNRRRNNADTYKERLGVKVVGVAGEVFRRGTVKTDGVGVMVVRYSSI